MGIANLDKARSFGKFSEVSFNGEGAELVRLSTVGTHRNSVPTELVRLLRASLKNLDTHTRVGI